MPSTPISFARPTRLCALLLVSFGTLECGNSTSSPGQEQAGADAIGGASVTGAAGQGGAASLADSGHAGDGGRSDSAGAGLISDAGATALGGSNAGLGGSSGGDAGNAGNAGNASSAGAAGMSEPGTGTCPGGMVHIKAKDQSFMMGFSAAEGGTEWACFIGKHKVTFTYDYCMDATLVTQKDYLKLIGNNPSSHHLTDTLPVDAVTWFDAALYCDARSKKDGLESAYSYSSLTRSGNHVTAITGLSYDLKKSGYRLPTNAEYEYAERANLTDYTYFFAKTAPPNINTVGGPADEYSWNVYNTGNTTHPVGTKKPNPWGLYDLVGNLFEWEHDWEGPYLSTDQIDPVGPANGDTPCGTDNTQTPKRMAKGGAYAQDVKNHERISYHYKFFPTTNNSQIGFRCVSSLR